MWEYKIEQKPIEEIIETKEVKYIFTYEKLIKNGTKVIVYRNGEEVQVVDYEKVPSPKKDESLLVQYSEDEFFKPIISEYKIISDRSRIGC